MSCFRIALGLIVTLHSSAAFVNISDLDTTAFVQMRHRVKEECQQPNYWYDASELEGDSMTTWVDKTGDTSHDSTSASGAIPVKQNGLNDMPYVEMRGKYFNVPGSGFIRTQVAVFRASNGRTVWNNYGAILGRRTARACTTLWRVDQTAYYSSDAPRNVWVRGGARQAYTSSLSPLNEWMVLAMEVDKDCADTTHYLGRSEHSQSEIDLAEVLGFKDVLTDAQRHGVEAYLIDKWGLEGQNSNDVEGKNYCPFAAPTPAPTPYPMIDGDYPPDVIATPAPSVYDSRVDFTLGPLGEKKCADGYLPIYDVATCNRASGTLSIPYSAADTDNSNNAMCNGRRCGAEYGLAGNCTSSRMTGSSGRAAMWICKKHLNYKPVSWTAAIPATFISSFRITGADFASLSSSAKDSMVSTFAEAIADTLALPSTDIQDDNGKPQSVSVSEELLVTFRILVGKKTADDTKVDLAYISNVLSASEFEAEFTPKMRHFVTGSTAVTWDRDDFVEAATFLDKMESANIQMETVVKDKGRSPMMIAPVTSALAMTVADVSTLHDSEAIKGVEEALALLLGSPFTANDITVKRYKIDDGQWQDVAIQRILASQSAGNGGKVTYEYEVANAQDTPANDIKGKLASLDLTTVQTTLTSSLTAHSIAVTITTVTQEAEEKIHARGDPHVTNVRGEAFDILMPATHTLLHIPRNADTQTTLLKIDATVKNLVPNYCKGLFIQNLKIGGKWLGALGALEFSTGTDEFNTSKTTRASMNGKEGTPEEVFVGLPSSKIVVHTEQQNTRTVPRAQRTKYVNLFLGGARFQIDWRFERIHANAQTVSINYLNIETFKMSKISDLVGIANIGGLLGVDDHTSAATSSPECSRRMIHESIDREAAEEASGSFIMAHSNED